MAASRLRRQRVIAPGKDEAHAVPPRTTWLDPGLGPKVSCRETLVRVTAAARRRCCRAHGPIASRPDRRGRTTVTTLQQLRSPAPSYCKAAVCWRRHDSCASSAVPTSRAQCRLRACRRGDRVGCYRRCGGRGNDPDRLDAAPVRRGTVGGRAAFEAARQALALGADLEQAVRSALDELGPLGWTVRHGVRWPGRGDVDHIVRSPDGPGFAIETKTLNFSSEHLRRTEAWARWVARRRRRYPLGVVPVVCVVRARRIESRYDDVVVVSLDRVLSVLQRLGANTGRAAGATRPLVAEP